MAWVAVDIKPDGTPVSETPKRVLENGPWWKAATVEAPSSLTHPPRKAEACLSHPAYPATNCGGCNADRLAGDPSPKTARRVTDPTPYTTAIRKQFGWTSKEEA